MLSRFVMLQLLLERNSMMTTIIMTTMMMRAETVPLLLELLINIMILVTKSPKYEMFSDEIIS